MPGIGRESAIYEPVKRFLKARGYEVKGEICDALVRLGDAVAGPGRTADAGRRAA